MQADRVLILSTPSDSHFMAVDWALRQAGVGVDLLFGNCFPRCERQSLSFDEDNLRYEAVDALGVRIDLLAAKSVWYRRGVWPKLSPALSAADEQAARDEADMFIRGVRSIAPTLQRWINAPDANQIAGHKPYQLYIARKVGLKVPRTVITNDPDTVRGFFNTARGDVLYKPLHGMGWVNDDGVAALYANKITLADIEDWDAIQLTAHMFQDYVDKSFELRITYLGGDFIACKLHSQEVEGAETDWRNANTSALRPVLYDLPQAVKDALGRYMAAMGLEYGAFDMIVDKDGHHVFLECNPSGQFLFLEGWSPDIPMLSKFLTFLTKGMDLTPAQRDKLASMRHADFRASGAGEGYYADLAKAYPVTYDPAPFAREDGGKKAVA